MKKFLILVLLVAMASSFVTATPIRYEYTPYDEAEFPIWSRELRRAETIFFGSYVVTLPLAYGLVGLGENTGLLSFEKPSGKAVSSVLLGTGLSLFISTLDYILGRIQ